MLNASKPYISFQPAPGALLHNYNLNLPASEQDPSIPAKFRDAMLVRETVFVNELHAVPLQHHIDGDDARSCHWVLYSRATSEESPPLPIGTIRLVRPPHSPHPEPGSRFEAPENELPAQKAKTLFQSPLPDFVTDKKTKYHDGVEPFIRLGRLSVIKEFRGAKFADLLIQAALQWVSENPEFVREALPEELKWKGLVCVHAHDKAASTWERNGFVIDEGMDDWFEGGLRHVGMFRRVEEDGK